MSILRATGLLPGGGAATPQKLMYYVSFTDPWSSDVEADILEGSAFSYGSDETDILNIMPGSYTIKVRIQDKSLYNDYVNLFNGYDTRISVRHYTGSSYVVIHHSKVDKYNVVHTDYEQTIEIKAYDVMSLMKEWDSDWNTNYMSIWPNTSNGRAWVDPAVGDANVWINVTRFINDLLNRTEVSGTIQGPGNQDFNLTRTFISATGYMPPDDFETQNSGAGVISWLYVPIVNYLGGAFRSYKEVLRSLMVMLGSSIIVYRGKAYLVPIYYRGYNAGGVYDTIYTIPETDYLTAPEIKIRRPYKAIKINEMSNTGVTDFTGYAFYPTEDDYNSAETSDRRDFYLASPCSPSDAFDYLGVSLSKNLAAWYKEDATDLVRRVRTDGIKIYINGAYSSSNNFRNHYKVILFNMLSGNKRIVKLTAAGVIYPPYKYYKLGHATDRTYRILSSKEDLFNNTTELELIES